MLQAALGWLRRGLDAVLYSSGWLAAAAGLLTAGTLHQAGFDLIGGGRAGHLPWLAFAATLLVYNLDAATPYKHGQPAGASARKQWQHRHRPLLLAMAGVAATVASWFFLVDGWWHHPVLLGHLAILALLYSVPLGKWKGRARALREIPFLKVGLIAYVWAAVTAGLPALALRLPLAQVWPLLGQRLLLVLALALVFDIRDFSRDQTAGAAHLPHGAGRGRHALAGRGGAGRVGGPGPIPGRSPRAAAGAGHLRRCRHSRRGRVTQ